MRYRDLETARELAEGDEIFLDEHLMRVDTIIDGPQERGFDATVICLRDPV